jgi:hypothetical protein
MSPRDMLERLRHELGTMGLASLAVLAASLVFAFSVLQPLEARSRDLERALAARVQDSASADAAHARNATPTARMAGFYRFLGTERKAVDWLEAIYAAGEKSGVRLRSAEYRIRDTGTRIERYEVRLPLRGNYTEIRSYLDTVLLDVPVLSLDEVKFKRELASDAEIEAELGFTLHLLKP